MSKAKWVTLLFVAGIVYLTACERSADSSSLSHIKDTKTKQYAIQGKILYENYCANCHQKDGSGLGKVIPPLAGADYMLEDVGRTARVIRHGLKGEITVNGVVYNQNMPANPFLTPMEIAQIMTYVYNVWGHEKGLIHANEVEAYLNN
jgi:cytochrome c551